MRPPRVYTRGILHSFGEIRRSTLLRSSSFVGSDRRIHPWTYTHGILRRRINPLAPHTSLGLWRILRGAGPQLTRDAGYSNDRLL